MLHHVSSQKPRHRGSIAQIRGVEKRRESEDIFHVLESPFRPRKPHQPHVIWIRGQAFEKFVIGPAIHAVTNLLIVERYRAGVEPLKYLKSKRLVGFFLEDDRSHRAIADRSLHGLVKILEPFAHETRKGLEASERIVVA